MPYDTSLDKELFSKEFEGDGGKIVISVHSYRNGPCKLQVTRQVKDRDGNLIYARLGRLSKEEAEGILPLIKEALEKM